MAARARPCIAGESGLLVKPRSAGALAEALTELLARSPRSWRRWGQRGRAHIAANYTVERMCAATLELYRELIEGRLAK